MKQRNGFSLIEILVVAVIFSLISVVIVQVFFTVMRTNSKTTIVRDVKEQGDRATEIMTRLVQNASSIDIPLASCPERPAVGATLDTVVLTNSDAQVTVLKCVEEVADGISYARIASVSASQTVYLTGSNVSLGSITTNSCANGALAFTCNAINGVPSYITISFYLRQKNTAGVSEEKASSTFQTTVSLRN